MSLNREQKIKKLANAVKDYRGEYNPNSGAWIVKPKPGAAVRVRKWLDELGVDAQVGMRQVDRIKDYKAFWRWLQDIREGNTPRVREPQIEIKKAPVDLASPRIPSEETRTVA